MARNFKRTRRNSARSRRRRSSNNATTLTRLARLMGQVDRGRSNSESRIAAAYESGRATPERRKKKPLF